MSRKYVIQKAIDRKDMSAKALAAMGKAVYSVMPKYDGCHAQFYIKDGEFIWAQTSTGDLVRSCDHIGKHLALTLPRGTFVVCGEVWMSQTPFAEISGAFRRHAPQTQLCFVPFDVVIPDADGALNDPRPWHQRIIPLEQTDKTWYEDFGPVYPFGFSDFRSMEDTEAYAKQLKEQGGYDGAMLINRQAGYKVGRCRDGEKIKIKPLLEFDLVVLGVELAKGDKTGKNTGALVCRYRDGKPVRVATGMTQAETDSMHEDPASWQGRIVAVEAMDETEDGSLREPRYKGVRTDKLAPDF